MLAAQTPPLSPAVSDLTGIWKRDATANQTPLRIQIVEFKNELVGINLDPQLYVGIGSPFLKALRSRGAISTLECLGFTDRGLVEWQPAEFKALAPDRFQVADGFTFTRIAKTTAGELPCDPQTTGPASGPEAVARGWIYTRLQNFRPATCWFHVGAVAEYPEAMMWYGSFLLLGRGTAKDVPQAFAILQKAAMQGSEDGAKQMAYMFGNAVGVLRSDQRSRYWKARAELVDHGFVHTSDFLPIPKWASDTAGPCDSSNSSHATEDAAFRAGRVAYQARAPEIAACWFGIAARLGSMKANLYLGIFNMYGFGVPKNPELGFQYVEKAANANDAFALMYLANFYRFGMGVKADHNHGSALVSKALRLPDGLDAFTHVEGTALSPEERGTQLMKGLSAFSGENTCNNLNAIDRSKSRDCTQTQGWFLGMMNRPARNTVLNPEEIMPENFEFVVPGDIAALKMAAKLGLTR